MPTHTPQPTQRMYPYLYVDDVKSYLAFLEKVLGFETRLLHQVDPEGTHVHAEAALGDVVVMMGRAHQQWGTTSPRRLGGLHSGIYVYVDDVDAHFRRARAAGATIESELEDKPYGDRMYTVRDPEGHQWYFATRMREVAG